MMWKVLEWEFVNWEGGKSKKCFYFNFKYVKNNWYKCWVVIVSEEILLKYFYKLKKC